ncbi:LPXTG cell wall anchor domain-containing protein [Streptomyces sp. BRB081]|nr:LPXTG cell wall anchor domain-containing protein [Streptomyces sp. BRB081]
MGGGGPAAGFSAPEMIRTGWLSGGEAVEVTESGTFTLRPLHGEGGGTRALDIPMGEDRLVVEYRHAAGSFDAGIEGVHAYRVPEGAYGSSSLIDLTEANSTAGNDAPADADAVTSLTDKAGKVSVAVVAAADGKAEIEVAVNGDTLTSGGGAAKEEARRPAAPDPEHTGTEKDAGDGLPGGVKADSAGREPADGPASGSAADLAATGGDASVLPLAAGGAVLVAAGAGALVVLRRRKRA